MTEAPIWPGVAEYLYHAASLACAGSDGTWIMPSAPTPRCSSLELTPMAGMSTDTGTERGSESPWTLKAGGPMLPAAASEGCGACSWMANAAPTAVPPPTIKRTPASPATRERRRPAARRPGARPGTRAPDLLGGGAYPLCGQDMTTRNPAIRRHSTSPNTAVPPSGFPRDVLLP